MGSHVRVMALFRGRPGPDLAISLNQPSTPRGTLKCADRERESKGEKLGASKGEGARESSANIAPSSLPSIRSAS